MISTVGRIFDKTKLVNPLNKEQRFKIYNSGSVSVPKKRNSKSKYSTFSTISRDHRDSYLLKVTNEPNVNNSYNVSTQQILPLSRRPTIDRASFTRIIGDVKDEDFSIPLKDSKKRCINSVSPYFNQPPLSTRDIHRWRKQFHHMDFSKQTESLLDRDKRVNQSTISTLNDLIGKTIESNFNNFQRFNLKSNVGKAHSFQSDSGHKYLNDQSIKKSPEYDTLVSKQEIIRPSLKKPKGETRFYRFKQKIATRFDRADPNWYTKLEYETNPQHSACHTINFGNMTNRQPNQTHSKYPFRISLTKLLLKKDQAI